MIEDADHELSDLYGDEWLLRLLRLCGAESHIHSGRPCDSPGKRPVEAGWVDAADRRVSCPDVLSRHVDALERHLREGGNLGLAIPRGVVALDADSPEAARFLALALSDAPYQETGRGAHVLLRVPDELSLKNLVGIEISPGIEVDIRAHGSQVVVEPSMHAKTGRVYAWKASLPRSVFDLPAAPDWLLEKLSDRRPATLRADRASEGTRNNHLTTIGGRLRRNGASEGEIRAELRRENAQHCDPPLPTSEVDGIARSVAGYPTVELPDTDLANSRRLVERCGADIRYCRADHTWYIWDGKRWAADRQGVIFQYAKDTALGILKESAVERDSHRQRRLAQFAAKSQSERAIRAMVALAESEPEVRVTPEQFDRDEGLLNLENGTLDLDSMKLRPHSRKDLLTKLAPTTYDPECRLEELDAFLERTLPDRDTRLFAQKAAGYTIEGRADRDLVILVQGPSRTGKGSFQGALEAMLGTDYVRTLGHDDLGRRRFSDSGPRPEIVRLAGARLVSLRETSSSFRPSAAQLKAMAGGDPISARGLHRDPIEFVPTFVIWMASNHLPIIANDDGATWERIRLIPFTEVVAEAKRDPEVRKRLREDPRARSAMLNWAVQGLRRLRAEGFETPENVLEATQQYRREMDPIADFLDDSTEIGEGQWVSAADLRSTYLSWCELNGQKPISAKRMAPGLKERGCVRRRRDVKGKRNQWIWEGIGLASR